MMARYPPIDLPGSSKSSTCVGVHTYIYTCVAGDPASFYQHWRADFFWPIRIPDPRKSMQMELYVVVLFDWPGLFREHSNLVT